MSIRKGLTFLELELETKKFPFSSDCFGTTRDKLHHSTDLPEFPFGGLHDTFNLYLTVLFLQQHLPSSFRTKLVEKMRPKHIGPMNFFIDINGDYEKFPNDPETTAVCYHALLKTNAIKEAEITTLAKSIYENVNDDGIIRTYYVSKESPRYNRLDAVGIINILRFAYELRHEHLVKPSEDYVFNWLNSGNYKKGTLYYHNGSTFLYFCSQLASTNYPTKVRFMDSLRQEFVKINKDDLKYPLDYALNILTGVELGIRDEVLVEKLLDMQNLSGSWPADAMYGTNHSKILFGSKSLSTIFAVLALMESL